MFDRDRVDVDVQHPPGGVGVVDPFINGAALQRHTGAQIHELADPRVEEAGDGPVDEGPVRPVGRLRRRVRLHDGCPQATVGTEVEAAAQGVVVNPGGDGHNDVDTGRHPPVIDVARLGRPNHRRIRPWQAVAAAVGAPGQLLGQAHRGVLLSLVGPTDGRAAPAPTAAGAAAESKTSPAGRIRASTYKGGAVTIGLMGSPRVW